MGEVGHVAFQARPAPPGPTAVAWGHRGQIGRVRQTPPRPQSESQRVRMGGLHDNRIPPYLMGNRAHYYEARPAAAPDVKPSGRIGLTSESVTSDRVSHDHIGVRDRLPAAGIAHPPHQPAPGLLDAGEACARQDDQREQRRTPEQCHTSEPRPDARMQGGQGRAAEACQLDTSQAARLCPGTRQRRVQQPGIPARRPQGQTRRSTDGSARSAPRMKTMSGRTAGSQ